MCATASQLERLKRAQPPEPDDEPATERRTTAADGLVRMAEKALATGEVDCSGADRKLVILHTTAEALAKDEGPSHLDLGPGVLAETARRLACDASLGEPAACASSPGSPLPVPGLQQSLQP